MVLGKREGGGELGGVDGRGTVCNLLFKRKNLFSISKKKN